MKRRIRRRKQKRKCGTCHVCCVTLSIEETDFYKPAYTPCHQLHERGRCKIYNERPPVCRMFSCMWLLGLFLDEHRPDRCGVVAHHVLNELKPGLGVNVVECTPGAFGDVLNQELLKSCEGAECRLVTFTGLDRRTRMYSRDPIWIADFRAKNPKLNIPADITAIDLEGTRDAD